MSNEPYIIDRLTAVDLFEKMLTRRMSHRILRLLGGGKMGKSHLLKEYRRRALQKHQMPCALIELGDAFPDPVSLLFHIRTQLRSLNFANFSTAHDEFSQRPTVNIQDNKTFASQLSINVSENKDSSDYRHRQLTEAFFKDLESLPNRQSLLICFDAFDHAPPTLQTWLQQHLFSGLCEFENVCVVVAGRKLPKAYLAWDFHCHDYELPALEFHHYEEFIQRLGLPLNHDHVKALYVAYEGRPGDLADVAPLFMGATL